jgi:hypothetical protein
MNMEIGAEATLFPEKEYINGIAVAVRTAGGKKEPYIILKLRKNHSPVPVSSQKLKITFVDG